MKNLSKLCKSGLIGGLALAAATLAPMAHAAVILAFGQLGTGDPVTGTQIGATTTISITGAPIEVTAYAGPGAPFSGFLTFSATNTSAATMSGADLLEHFSGSFCISSGAGCSGTKFLQGTFIDLLAGKVPGHDLTFGATTPPSTDVTFTSDILTPAQLGLDRAITLSFSDVNPSVAICGSGATATICSFTADVSGNMSANNGHGEVPEPGTLALLALGVVALGFLTRRKKS